MLWLSLGENCLSDDILKRHKLKSFSTPFSACRSNIDIATQATEQNFAGFLEPSALVPDVVGRHHVLRSRLYTSEPGVFASSCSQGFELTHHDVVSNEKHRTSVERKIQRWQETRLAGTPVTFLYHHRYWPGCDPSKIVRKLENFRRVFRPRIFKALRIIMFHQSIVDDDALRGFRISKPSRNITTVEFLTRNSWSGNDHIWAHADDDLIGSALRAVGASPAPTTKSPQHATHTARP